MAAKHTRSPITFSKKRTTHFKPDLDTAQCALLTYVMSYTAGNSGDVSVMIKLKTHKTQLNTTLIPLYAYLNPSFSSPLSPSITPSLFHSKLKAYLFGQSFPP